MNTACPSCGSTSNARFGGSHWCVPCVDMTLADQERESAAPIRPQVFSV